MLMSHEQFTAYENDNEGEGDGDADADTDTDAMENANNASDNGDDDGGDDDADNNSSDDADTDDNDDSNNDNETTTFYKETKNNSNSRLQQTKQQSMHARVRRSLSLTYKNRQRSRLIERQTQTKRNKSRNRKRRRKRNFTAKLQEQQPQMQRKTRSRKQHFPISATETSTQVIHPNYQATEIDNNRLRQTKKPKRMNWPESVKNSEQQRQLQRQNHHYKKDTTKRTSSSHSRSCVTENPKRCRRKTSFKENEHSKIQKMKAKLPAGPARYRRSTFFKADILPAFENAQSFLPYVRWCGTHESNMSKFDFVSRSNEVMLNFHSDYSITGFGFAAVWKAIDVSGCPLRTLTSREGTIFSPNYPHFLLNNLNCAYVIQAPVGKRVWLEFTEYDFQTDALLEVDIGHGLFRPFRLPDHLNDGLFVSLKEQLRVQFRTGQHPRGKGFQAIYHTGE